MKYKFFFIFIFVNFLLSGQVTIKCKSGQILNLSSTGDLISTNSEELVKLESLKSDIREIFDFLLKKERVNRQSFYLLEKENTVLLSKKKVDEKSADKLKYNQAALSNLQKEYKKINNAINKIRQRDKATIESVSKEMIMKSEEEASMPKIEGSSEITLPKDERNIEIEDTTLAQKSSNINLDSINSVVVNNDQSDMISRETSETKQKSKTSDNYKQPPYNNSTTTHRKKNENKAQLSLATDCSKFTFSGKDSYETPYELYTQFTPEKLENYFKQESFLNLSLALDVSKDSRILKVKCDFIPKDIDKSYGTVVLSDFLRIQFINGKNIFLKAIQAKGPIIEQYTGHSIYEISYKFENEEDLYKLKESLVDTIGIMWSSGFEAYQVYNIDYFITLFNEMEACKKAKQP